MRDHRGQGDIVATYMADVQRAVGALDHLSFRAAEPRRSRRGPVVALLAVAVGAGSLGAWIVAGGDPKPSVVEAAGSQALPERDGKAPPTSLPDTVPTPSGVTDPKPGSPGEAVRKAGEAVGYPEVIEWYPGSDGGWIAMYGDGAEASAASAEVSIGRGPDDAAELSPEELGQRLLPASVVVEHERLGTIFVSQGSFTNIGILRDGWFVSASIDRSVDAEAAVARFETLLGQLELPT